LRQNYYTLLAGFLLLVCLPLSCILSVHKMNTLRSAHSAGRPILAA